jgi:hypothetical protein
MTDWDAIEMEYIYGTLEKDEITGKNRLRFPSQREIAEKYKIGEVSVATRSSKGKWMIRREKYIGEYGKRVKSQNMREILISRNEKAGETLKQIDALTKLTNYYLSSYREILNYDKGDDSFDFREIDEEQMKGISIRDLKTLMEIIEKVQKLSDEVLKLEEKEEETGGMSINENKEIENTLKVLEKRVMQTTLNKRRGSKIEAIKAANQTRVAEANKHMSESE